MGHIEIRLGVAASPDRVFDLVVDTARYDEWQTMTQELLSRSGPADAIGASFAARYRVLGRSLQARFVVTSAIRPYLHELTGTTRGGWARWSTHIEVDGGEPADRPPRRSLVHVALEYRVPGELLGGMFGLLADPILRREIDRTYDRLRLIAEAAEAADARQVAAAGVGRRERPTVPPSAS
jgi:hypothetical protein